MRQKKNNVEKMFCICVCLKNASDRCIQLNAKHHLKRGKSICLSIYRFVFCSLDTSKQNMKNNSTVGD